MAIKKVAVKTVRAAVAAPAAKLVGISVNQVVRIKAGPLGELAGTVQAISEDGTRALVLVDALEWLTADQLEANK